MKKDTLANGDMAIKVLARMAARSAVKEELRAEGKHPSRMRAADIERQAQQYLDDHRELWRVALDRAIKIGFIEPGDQEILTWRCWKRQCPEIIPYPAFPEIERRMAEGKTLIEVLRGGTTISHID
jgi:hypothetical protein